MEPLSQQINTVSAISRKMIRFIRVAIHVKQHLKIMLFSE